jgi:hypothetical protein
MKRINTVGAEGKEAVIAVRAAQGLEFEQYKEPLFQPPFSMG